ncbi:MAG: EAL domain-containing protein [Pseudomonadota bacterium]
MAAKIKTVYLLISDPSSNEAEKTINILRNSGYAVRAEQVESEEALQVALERQNWDLYLSKPKVKDLNAFQAFKIVQHYGKDLPFILILNDFTIELIREAMKLGIHGVAPATDPELIRLMIQHELENANHRKCRRRAEHALKEAEIRCNLLLQSSRDAIAYVHDGMHIYTNDAYAELFGYEDQDELACIPVMDIISSDYQEAFKQFLREFKENSTNEFSFEGLKDDGSTFNAMLSLSPATYDGEECTQVLIRAGGDSAELEQKLKELSAVDQLTGFYNRQHLLESLVHASGHAANNNENFAFFYIEADQFDQVRSDYGISGTDELIKQTANFVLEQNIESEITAKVSDEGFGILFKNQKPDEAKNIANNLVVAFSKQLIDIQGRTLHCTLSIGIAFITEKSPSGDKILMQAYQAFLRVHKKEGNGVRVYNPAFEQAAGSSNAELVEKIQEALETNKMFLTYQPISKLHGELAEYYQVYLRMENDEGELVPPTELFPITNQSGLTAKLDRWVIAQALRTANSERKKQKNTQLFVQLSGGSIIDDTLASFIQSNLRKARLPSDALIIGLHETDAAAYLKRAIAFTEQLQSSGIKIAMSGFGSSLNPEGIFSHINIDYVILDGSFTNELFSNSEINEKVQQLIEAAHEQDKVTIVPEVDDASSLAALYPLGVKYIQGDYLQAPGRELDFDFNESEL